MFASKKIFSYLAYFTIALGIVFRIVIYFQNRNLIIDEANIARNIVERDFAGLAKPLNYEQYAPPVFLWITKLSTLLFGTSELAFRLFPFLCGILGLLLLYALLKKFAVNAAAWYPLFLMATGWIYVRYGTEVKQYASDVVIAICILLLALKISIPVKKKWQFFLIWFVTGSIAIWSSMPSVFILAGAGTYYFAECVKLKRYKDIGLISVIAMAWLAQFYFYYSLILEPQIQSSYLQNWHKNHFLFLLPSNTVEWSHNIEALSILIYTAAGKWAVSVFPHLLFIFTGFILLFRKNIAAFFLFLIPVLSLLIAAGFNQFSLLPRVSLFIMPILLLLIGLGLNYYLSLRFLPLKIILLLCGAVTMYNFNELIYLFKPMKFEKITESFEWIQQKTDKNHIYMHGLIMPQNIYYTSIHPDSAKWNFMKQSIYFYWNTDMDSLCKNVFGKNVFVFGWLEDWDLQRSTIVFPKYFTTLDSLSEENRKIYYFERK